MLYNIITQIDFHDHSVIMTWDNEWRKLYNSSNCIYVHLCGENFDDIFFEFSSISHFL